MSFLARYLPPYYKYAVFLLAGFQLIFSCVVLSIAEAYYKAAKMLLPIAYRIFDDTVAKRTPDFNWNENVRNGFEIYRDKLMILWAVSTVAVLLCMFQIIPQFFEFNNSRGNPGHLCIVKRRLGWILFTVHIVVTIALGAVIVWTWHGTAETVSTFHTLFSDSHKEEEFVSELENQLDCINDDDKEVPEQNRCEHNVNASMIKKYWLDGMMICFFVGHFFVFAIVPLFNRQLSKNEDDEKGEKLLNN